MKMIMRAYDYFFYTFYRFWEMVPSRWWSEWKASITMLFLCGIVLSSINNIQYFLFRKASLFDYPYISLSLGLVLGFIHHFMYTYNDRWKDKITKFKDIEKKKDSYGILVVLVSAILVISIYIYSNHLLRTVNR